MKLQKLGGYAAIATIFTFIIIAIYSNIIKAPDISSDPEKAMTSISAAPVVFYILILLFMVSCILGLAMFVALHERMHADATYLSHMMLIAVSASVAIWITESIVYIKSIGMLMSARDLSAYRALWTIREALHFAGGHACGWACLFLGCAILLTRSFPLILGLAFLVTGILWIPTFFLVQIGFRLTIPIFSLTFCAATIWIGIVMLRQNQLSHTGNEMAELE